MECKQVRVKQYSFYLIGLLLELNERGEFPGSPVVRTSPSSVCGDADLTPGWGARIPHASEPKKQNIKQKQYCNKFNKDFKNGLHQRKNLKNKTKQNL